MFAQQEIPIALAQDHNIINKGEAISGFLTGTEASVDSRSTSPLISKKHKSQICINIIKQYSGAMI